MMSPVVAKRADHLQERMVKLYGMQEEAVKVDSRDPTDERAIGTWFMHAKVLQIGPGNLLCFGCVPLV